MLVRLRLKSRGCGGGASDAARSQVEPGNENHENPMLLQPCELSDMRTIRHLRTLSRHEALRRANDTQILDVRSS